MTYNNISGAKCQPALWLAFMLSSLPRAFTCGWRYEGDTTLLTFLVHSSYIVVLTIGSFAIWFFHTMPQRPQTTCPAFERSADTLRVQLAVENGRRIAEPINAAILVMSDYLGPDTVALYADSDTRCTMLGRTSEAGSMLQFASSRGTLFVSLERATHKVRVVYPAHGGLMRETAPAE
jgi:hypothetical protein